MSIYNLFAKLGFSALAEPAPPPEQDLEQQPDNDQKEEIKISTESKDDESEQQPRVKPHLVIVTDSTGSMGTYLQGLRVSLKQIFPLVSLTDAFDRVAILWYHDYCDKKQVGCSPWARDFTELVKHAEGLMPDGGGDCPEAAKTAAYELVKLVAKAPSGNKVPTIVFWYADAPPHHATNKSSDNYDKELKFLGASRFDWMNICRHLRENNIIVYPIVTSAFPFFAAMAEITGGRCIQPAQLTTNGISFTTMNALMGILGTQHDPAHCYSVPQNFNPQAMENEAGACLVQGAGSENVLLNARVPLNLNAFVRRIPRDEEYTTLAFRVFDQLVQPDTVLALTTNNVFGTFWRALCKQREDPRRDELVARLGGVKTKLPPKEQEELKQWLDQSYNRLEDIQEAIKKVPTYPALVLELPEGDKYSAQDLLEISRSCNSQILKRLTTLVVNMRMVEAGPLPEDYLPISLDDRNLFSFLPHLMCQGTTFDRRASMLMAAVCTLARHPQLAERANEFLMREKGKGWQQWELPESFAAGFVRLLLRVPHALTEEELVNVQKLNRIASFVFNLNTALQTEVPYTPSKSIRRDRKERCVECNLLRSLTLLSPTGVCGLCLQAAQPLPPGGFQGKNACVHVAPRVEEGSVSELKGSAAHAEPCDDDHSFMVECAECHGIYALVRVALLSARPKCFYCRNGGRAPVRTCQVCTNRFVMPRASDWDEKQLAEPYTCASCEFHPELAWEAATVTVKQLLEYDRAAVERVLALTIPEEFVRSGMLSLFKLKELIAPRPESEMPIFCWPRVALAAGDDVEDAEKKEKIADDQHDHEHKRDEEIKLEVAPLVTLKGKPVRHSGAVWSQMQQWCSTQNAQLGTCMLCFSDVPKFRLSRCCGRRRCETLACRDCLTHWYGQVKRGELVMASHLACPFCKNTPTFKAVRQFNAAAGDLLRTRNPEFEATWWYGWCRTCDCIQQAVEKNCAAETPVLNNFQCGGCRERQLDNAVKVKARECPNCSVMVEKIDGCNHITCNCGTHWCFACGGAFDDGNIYDHMAEAHGGGYFAEDEE